MSFTTTIAQRGATPVAPTAAALRACRAVILTSLLVAGAAGAESAVEPAPTSLAAFVALPRPSPKLEVKYGPAPTQAADVFLPAGTGPFPVAVLIHGGCWRDLPGAGRAQLRHIGAALAARGVAVWSLGYGRADEPGGGYPGIYLDVGAGLDRLRGEAGRLNLDFARTVAVGHSAGVHRSPDAERYAAISPAEMPPPNAPAT